MSKTINCRKSLAFIIRIYESFGIYEIIAFVWITKYYKQFLTGYVKIRMRELIREIFKSIDIEVSQGYVSKGQVYML